MPQWGRLLLIGLAASVLLHGMALDFWRGVMRLDGQGMNDFQAAPLRAKLQSPVLVRAAALPAARQAGPSYGLPSMPARSPASTAEKVGPRDVAAESVPLVSVLPKAVPERMTAETGLRPLSAAEGLVAYRLALLAELRLPAAGNLANPLHIMLSRHDDDVALDVVTSSGDATVDRGWLHAVSHAVAGAVLPSVLVGQAFSLDLEIRP